MIYILNRTRHAVFVKCCELLIDPYLGAWLDAGPEILSDPEIMLLIERGYISIETEKVILAPEMETVTTTLTQDMREVNRFTDFLN